MFHQSSQSRNRYGLFDSPQSDQTPKPLVLTLAIVKQQFADGAFLMSESDALKEGFLNPYETQELPLIHGE